MPIFSGVLQQTCRSLLANEISLASNFRINEIFIQQVRWSTSRKPYTGLVRTKFPRWFLQRERAKYDEQLTKQNKEFIEEVVEDTFGPVVTKCGITTYDIKSPLKQEPISKGEWNIKSIRSGLIVRNIGVCPIWMKNGERILCTMFQVIDNHVIKYIPPEEFNPPRIPYRCPSHKKKLGCLLVGAESADPQLFTREYSGLFFRQGLMPKKYLGRFLISPESAMQPGTALTACHFKPGAYVDVRGKTIDRGFQGCMVRWGFRGMPATHGQTKTHRRPGCIGGPKARVWPGKKMPGHMGNRFRYAKGLQIMRINTKYNVLWISGTGCPGGTGSISYIYDTAIYPKRTNHKNQPYFPTFFPEDLTEPLPENLYADGVFQFTDPTITYELEQIDKKKQKK